MTSKSEKKNSILLLATGILFIAGLLDLKYKGLFYQLLPNKLQSYISDVL